MSRHLALVAIIALFVTGCGAPPTATPDAVATQVAQAQAVASTLTVAVEQSWTPTATDTLTPTATHTPTATPTPTVTHTPSPTLSPTPRPTRRPTNTPTSTPIPQIGTKQNPLPLGEAGVFEIQADGEYFKIQLMVSDVLRGEEAQRRIRSLDGSCYVDAGQEECIAVHILLDYLDGSSEEPENFGALSFGMVTKTGTFLLSSRLGSAAQAIDFSGRGYPPLHVEGWRYCQIRLNSDPPMLVFWPGLIVSVEYGMKVPMIYLSLEDTGSSVSSVVTQIPTVTAEPTTKPARTLSPTPTLTPTPAMQLIADSQADFSGSQGQNSWEYMFAARDTFNWKQLTFDGSCYRVTSGEPLMGICADQGAPGLEGDIAWLYKAETSGRLLFRVTARKAEASGDDIEICAYRHTSQLKEWDLHQGDTKGFTDEFEVDANGGEMFFFTMQVSSIWREFKDDPNVFRVQVYLK